MMLRCFAEQHDGAWEALCVDLDLAVKATASSRFTATWPRPWRSIWTTCTLPAAEQRRLLRRRAPLALRLRFVGAALALAFLPRPERRGRAEFTLPAAA